MDNKVRILQVLGGGDSIGGVERMLLNYYSHINKDKYVFDFCFIRENTFQTIQNEYGDLLADSKIYELSVFNRKSNFIGYFKSIGRIHNILCNKYEVVHINAGRPALLICGLIAASAAHTRLKIVHSHSTNPEINKSLVKKTCMRCVRKFLNSKSNYKFACSEEAGKYMFGEGILSDSRFRIIHNAIDPLKYAFDCEKRKKLRKEFSIDENTTVYAHIGRLSDEKNHSYLLDIYYSLRKKNSNSVLWIIGDGERYEAIRQKITDLNLDDSVRMFGARKDIPELLQAIDVMIFPSLYEGLSVTLVEAQAASVMVYASDSISKEHQVTDLIEFLPLNEGTDRWANHISKYSIKKKKNMIYQIINNGYSIENVAHELEDIYAE